MEGHSLVPWQNGTMLCYGGKRGDKYTSDLWVISMREEGKAYWKMAPSTGTAPTPRAYHTASLWRERFMLVIGGVGEYEKGGVENHFWMYEEKTGWRVQEAVGDAPVRRCHHSVSTNPGTDMLYLYGGYPVGPNAAELFNVAPGTAAPVHRDFFEVHQLNLMGATPTWRRITATNTPPMLWGHTSTLFANNLIIFGGVDVVDSKESKTMCVWHSDRYEWRWVDFANGPVPRALHSAVVESSNDKMYVFGGFGNVNTMKFNDTWCFSAEAGQWTPLKTTGPLTVKARSGHASCLLPGKRLFIHGGINADGNVVSDSQLLDIATGLWSTISATRTEPPKLPIPSPSTPAPPPPHDSPQRQPQAESMRPVRGVVLHFHQPLRNTTALSHTIARFLAISPQCVAVSSSTYSSALITITGLPTANELSEELLRRCLHPQDPLRAAAGISGAEWEGENRPLPDQMSHYPLREEEVVPFSDDRRLVQTYHVEQPELEVIRPPSPAAHPEPAKFGMSQGCQTKVVQETQADQNENLIILQQKEEIDELRRRVNAAEKSPPPSSITGYLRLPDEYDAGPAPMLSASTPMGPELKLTKVTLADMLPGTVQSRQIPGMALPQVPKVSAAAAAHVLRSSTALTVERRASENINASILDPSRLPTAHTDPSALAPSHERHPSYPYTGNPPVPLPGTGPSIPDPKSIPTAPPRMPQAKKTSGPTLKDIINGKASMLSITHLGR